MLWLYPTLHHQLHLPLFICVSIINPFIFRTTIFQTGVCKMRRKKDVLHNTELRRIFLISTFLLDHFNF